MALTTVHCAAKAMELGEETAASILSSIYGALELGPISDLTDFDELEVVRGERGSKTVNISKDQVVISKSSIVEKTKQKRNCPTKNGAVLGPKAVKTRAAARQKRDTKIQGLVDVLTITITSLR